MRGWVLLLQCNGRQVRRRTETERHPQYHFFQTAPLKQSAGPCHASRLTVSSRPTLVFMHVGFAQGRHYMQSSRQLSRKPRRCVFFVLVGRPRLTGPLPLWDIPPHCTDLECEPTSPRSSHVPGCRNQDDSGTRPDKRSQCAHSNCLESSTRGVIWRRRPGYLPNSHSTAWDGV